MFLTLNIKDYISNNLIYGMRDTTTNGNLKNLKVINFPIPLYLTIYSARFSLALSTALMV